jgi:starch synthase (maltosyl-transferring)
VDLATIDNAASPDRNNLWQYWLRLVRHYAAMGVDGYRCDAAYQVPTDLWRFLIGSARREFPRLQFFAETLGCTPEQTMEVAGAGFDFIFNSSKWWDFSAPWCLDQYRRTAPVVPSISFPESHDTERLAQELEGSRAAVRQRYVFSALFSTGVMIPIGFEFGFRKRLHVVNSRPEDWESPVWYNAEFIRQVNEFKARHRIWNEEGPAESLDVENPSVLALAKQTRDGRQRALLLLNKERRRLHSCKLAGAASFLGDDALEVSAQFTEKPATLPGEITLPPAGFQIFLSTTS